MDPGTWQRPAPTFAINIGLRAHREGLSGQAAENRGQLDQLPQRSLLAIVDLEERVPRDHPLRRINAMADVAPERLSPEFDHMYASTGRTLFEAAAF